MTPDTQTPNILEVKALNPSDIHWKDGKMLYDWWEDARGERPFPARREFSPSGMVGLLPSLQLIDVGGADRTYSVRLVGTKVTETLGFDPTGKKLDEIPNTAQVRLLYDWVVENKKPVLRKNVPITWANKDYKTFSTLVLPLGNEAEGVNMILLHFNFGTN